MSFYTEITPANNYPAIGWHSVIRPAVLNVSSQQAGRTVENLWAPDTASYWQPQAESNSSIGFAQFEGEPNYIGIVRHNLGSSAISYQLFYQLTNGAPLQPLSGVVQPLDNSPILHEFTPPPSNYFITLRFYHSAQNLPIVAHVKLGNLLRLQRKIFVGHKPIGLTQYADGVTQTSESGQYLGRINTSLWRKSSVSQSNITQDFIYQHIAPFIAHANCTAHDNGTPQGPYFFCARPETHPQDVVYGWTHNTIHPDNQQANGMMGFNFDIEGIV